MRGKTSYNYTMQKLSGKLSTFFSSRRGGVVALIIAIGSFLGLTLTRLTGSSIWFDESFSSYLMHFDWAGITHYTALDVHPPFYYYCLKLWTNLFGNTPVTIRLLSVVLGVIAIILAFRLAGRLFGRQIASLAAILLAISPLFVRYGIEARMYMLVAVIGLLGIMTYLRAETSGKRCRYLLYGFIIALGMWTHYLMVTVWLSVWVYRYLRLRRQGCKGRKLLRSFFSADWLIVHAVAIAAFLPWIPHVLHQLRGMSSGYWIPAVTVNTLGDYWSSLTLYSEASGTDGWWAVLVWVIFALTVAVSRQVYCKSKQASRPSLLLTLVVAVAPILWLMLLSFYPFKSVFVDRYLMVAVIFTVIWLAVIIIRSPNRQLAGLLLTLVVVASICGVHNVYRLGNYNRYFNGSAKNTMTGEVVEQINATKDNTPIILTGAYNYYEAAVYEQKSHPVYYVLSEIRDSEVGSLQMLKDNRLGKGITDLQRFLATEQQVWLAGYSTDQAAIAPLNRMTGWRAAKTISVPDPITGESHYKATLYVKQ